MRSLPPRVLDQPGGNLALDLFVLGQHLGALLDRALDGTGVPPAQYAVYAQLDADGSTPGHLAQTLGLAPATLSGYLAAIRRRGHLRVAPHARDGRSRVVSLTPAGEAQREACRERLRRALAALHAELGPPEVVDRLRGELGVLDAAVLAAGERVMSGA